MGVSGGDSNVQAAYNGSRPGGSAAVAIKVLVADDHKLMVEGVRYALETVDDIEIVAEASDGTQVLRLIHQTSPDLVLLDLRMPGMSGLACLEAIREKHPKLKVVVLSAFSDEEHIRSAFERGAAAYVVKSVSPLDLPSAIRQVFESTVFQSFRVMTNPSEDSTLMHGLTDREAEMLKALARGLSNSAIGKELWVTEQTVKFHLRNIYRKLGVANRTEAARFAYDCGLSSTYA
jgi:DNA-binding NarL/FixJ family response regulator